MTADEDREALAEALLAKWKREWAEEAASLPASVDPELLSAVSDTSHGELALEYADALLSVVDAIARRRAAEELRALADEIEASTLAYRAARGGSQVSDTASYGTPMTMPMGTTCAVHTHRDWVPIERHHVWPIGMGGPDVAANIISVCANGHYAIHEVIRRLIANDGRIPEWEHFGAKVRRYALQGWTDAGKPTHGGGEE